MLISFGQIIGSSQYDKVGLTMQTRDEFTLERDVVVHVVEDSSLFCEAGTLLVNLGYRSEVRPGWRALHLCTLALAGLGVYPTPVAFL